MPERNDTQLVTDALTISISISNRGKLNAVIVLSDQGNTYSDGDYRSKLRIMAFCAE
jgi:transposase InsO family protein